jgi:hypothetical protein
LGDRQRGDAVSTPVTADEARRLVLEPSDVELWSIGHSLDQNAPAFSDGVSTQLVACMLEVGEPENWDRTTRRAEKPKDLFRPYRNASCCKGGETGPSFVSSPATLIW